MNKVKRIVLLLLLLGCLRAEAVIGVTTPSSEWVPVLYLSDADPTGDQQTAGAGGSEADIVGNSSYAALYKKYDGTDFGFRIRMGADSNPSGYDSATILGMDVTGDGSLDYYIGMVHSITISGWFTRLLYRGGSRWCGRVEFKIRHRYLCL